MTKPKYELYETHPSQIMALKRNIPLLSNGGWFLDPCVGTGIIPTTINAMYDPSTQWITNDIDFAHSAMFHTDASTNQLAEAIRKNPQTGGTPVDWVIANPPFSVAYEILIEMLAIARVGVAFILPLSFEEPTEKRGAFLQTNPPMMKILFGQPRPRYTGKGTYLMTTGWYVWLNPYGHSPARDRLMARIQPNCQLVYETDWLAHRQRSEE